MIRALVVDDTILYRTLVSEALKKVPGVRVVGSAPDGRTALSKIRLMKPDLVTLDIEMPVMNGIEVLRQLAGTPLDTAVVVVSSLTRRGGDLTLEALSLGAFDFVTKPETRALQADFERVLGVIVAGVVRRREIQALLKSPGAPAAPSSVVQAAPLSATRPKRQGPSDVVVIGISTGGPAALLQLVPELPADLAVPVVIVQHMPPMFTANLAHSLSGRSRVPVKEAEDGETLHAGTVYIAPGGRQTKIVLASDAKTKLLRVTDDAPENGCRPSADYLFRSAAHLFYGKATAVIMTGMGSDGLEGMRALRQADARILAQDAASCVVYGMPKAVVDDGLADQIVPLDRLAAAVTRTLR